MKACYLILILISLFVNSCKDDKAIRRHRDLSFLLGLFEMGFFKPNYCSPPQLLLEEGKTYNITLEAGKRFWFDYAIRSQGFSKKMYRLTINKELNSTIDYQLKNCRSQPDLGTRKIVSSSPTQIIYESESFSYSSDSDSNAHYRFFIESNLADTNLSIFFNQF
jgi:hypothetical protein